MKRSLYTTALLAGLALAGWVVVSPEGLNAQADGEAPEGETLFVGTFKCNMCHGVPAAGIEAKTKSEKMKGAPLGGPIDSDLATLAAYLRKETDRDGAEHKKKFTGSDEELQAIVDWLATLEAPTETD